MTLAARVAQVPADELSRLVADLRTLDQRLGSVVAVSKDQIKDGGLFGIGRESMQDKMRKNLQTQVERVSRQIKEGRLSGDDLVNGLCSRAESLADLGRAAEGLKDAEEAAKSMPASGRAHECLGNLLFATGDYSRAVAEYSRALPLSDDTFPVYYRRGHARFYDGKLEQAAEDFAKAAAEKQDASDRLYAQLWQVWTLQLAKRPLPAALETAARQQPDGAWPRPALAMLVGAVSPEQMLARLQATLKGDELELAQVEAQFYLGQYHRVRGEAAPARQAFEKAREKNVTMYIEHVAAGIELAREPK
jgi:lipoprotein NlpI